MRYRLITLLIGLLSTVSLAYGQRSVSGTIVSQQGATLSGATVVLSSTSLGMHQYGRISDRHGDFHITGIAPGMYTMAVSFVGFARFTREVDLRETDLGGLRVELNVQALPQSEIVVSASRAEPHLQPMTVSNISAEELARSPDMKDLPVILSRHPSITQYSENGNGIGYSTLRMRGFGQRRLAIAINDIPQNDPEEFNVFWVNFFDLQGAIDDIQIQRGAGSSVYGPSAIGGAINIRAMPYRPYRYASIEVGGGAFGTRRYSAEVNSGLLGDRYVVFGRFSRLVSDGYRDWSWTRFWRFFAGVTRYGKNSTLTLQAFGGPQRDGLAFSGIPKAANRKAIPDGFGSELSRTYNFSASTRDVEDFHQPHVEIHHEWKVSDAVRFNQALFWIQGKGFFDFGGTFRSANYLRLPVGVVPELLRDEPLYISKPEESVLFRAFLDQWQIGWLPRLTTEIGRSTLSIGAELRLHRSLRWGRIQEASSLSRSIVGSDADVRVYSFRGEKKIASVFGSLLTRLGDQWALQSDVQLTYRRYRVYEEQFFGNRFNAPYTFLNPRIGLTYRPESDWSGYVSIALAHREPRMKSLYDGEEAGAGFLPAFARSPDGSFDFDRPDVRSERLVDIELGTGLRRPEYRLSVDVFLMDFRNEIVPSGTLDQFGVPRTGNADHTRHLGLEAEGVLSLGRGISMDANLTLTRNRFQSFVEFATLPDFSTVAVSRDNNPIAGFPDRSGNIGLNLDSGGLQATLHTTFVGRQYVDNSGGVSAAGTHDDSLVIDAYELTDLSVRYVFRGPSSLSGLRLGLDVNNVFDDKILAFGNAGFGTPQFFPLATRHVFVTLAYTMQ